MSIELSPEPLVHGVCRIHGSVLGPWTEIGNNTTISESTFGAYSYTAGDVSIIYADVGPFCSLASHVRINPGNHAYWRVAQHHMTYRRQRFGFAETDDQEFFQWRRDHRCTIGHDVWIGHGAIVMPGVKVGNGAIIGSGAVVTHDVGDYEVWVGVPARFLRRRFSPEISQGIESTRWWEWDHETLAARLPDFNDPSAFIAAYGSATTTRSVAD